MALNDSFYSVVLALGSHLGKCRFRTASLIARDMGYYRQLFVNSTRLLGQLIALCGLQGVGCRGTRQVLRSIHARAVPTLSCRKTNGTNRGKNTTGWILLRALQGPRVPVQRSF